MKIEPEIMQKVSSWLEGNYDEKTKASIRDMIENDPQELRESFYKNLEFGTGGLRGIMGVGTNRVNIYTISMATQGLSNYLLKMYPGEEISVAIAYDCRNNSKEFARSIAGVFAANNINVYLFDALRPTPVLSFTIRHFGCKSGVVLTASHNPKEYNGYKAYWNDGAQVTDPHDTNIIEEVNKIESIDQVKMTDSMERITIIGEDVDNIYLDMVERLSLSPEAVRKHNQMKIVYTPIHGTGVHMVPAALKRYGFTNIISVPEQNVIDGNFPTVEFPNPEEPSAMKMAIDKANEVGADLVLATDPDADRQALAVRDETGKLRLLNGNQTASLLTYYLCRRWSELGKINGKQYIVKTVVTSELLAEIGKSFGVQYFDTLTGFKFIAEVVREHENDMEYIGGGEESFGYMIGQNIRDKDGVSAIAILAECAAWAADQGMTMWQLLQKIYLDYNFYKEGLIYIVKKGMSGAEEIAQMMSELRQNPPKEICGSPVVEIRDYLLQRATKNGQEQVINQPKSNVLQFFTQDNTIVSARPSGTEPKIKFYFSVREKLSSIENFHATEQRLDGKITQIQKELNLA